MGLRISVIAGVLFTMISLSWAQNCKQSAILSPSPFNGNSGEIFQLVDGSFWEVKDGKPDINLCEYNPDVMICPSWRKLVINGNMLHVEQVRGRKSEPTLPSRKASSTK